MTTIDLGNGQSVPRHQLPATMLRAFDEASASLNKAQAAISAWVRQQYAMQAPADVSGAIVCNASDQSGRSYTLSEPGGALLVDLRDVAAFQKLGFLAVPSGSAPTTGLRPGLVFMDQSLGEYMRYDGANWAPVTLT